MDLRSWLARRSFKAAKYRPACPERKLENPSQRVWPFWQTTDPAALSFMSRPHTLHEGYDDASCSTGAATTLSDAAALVAVGLSFCSSARTFASSTPRTPLYFPSSAVSSCIISRN